MVRILFLKSKEYIDNLIESDMERAPLQFYVIDRNLVQKDENLPQIANYIMKNSINAVLAVNYSQRESLFCGALGICYISWLIDPNQTENHYSVLNNKWNIIFTSIPNIYENLKKDCMERLFFLPLSYKSLKVEEIDKSSEDQRIVFWTDSLGKTATINSRMKELKDSTKGYLDAVLELCRSSLDYKIKYSSFPDYIKEDLKECYPNDSKDMQDSDFYNTKFFYPVLDRTVAYTYMHYLISSKTTSSITFVADEELPYTNKEFNYINKYDLVKSNYMQLNKNDIIVFFARFSDEQMISQELWNLLSSRSFVLCSANVDWSFMGESKPVCFKNIFDLERKVRLYMSREPERTEQLYVIDKMLDQVGPIEVQIDFLIKKIEEIFLSNEFDFGQN